MQQLGKFILMNLTEFSDYLTKLPVSRIINLVQNHHTYIPNYSQFTGNNHFGLCQAMETAHLQRGFSEIAQNLTTFPDGTVVVCRSIDKIPAGIKGANTNGICIENVGNFDTDGDVMRNEQRDCIIAINALLCNRLNITPNTDNIVYHHWYDLVTGLRTNGTGSTKSCPGTNFFGGNTVDAAQQNFIPLITAYLQNSGVLAVSLPGNLQHARVRVPLLNVRSGPGTNFSVVSQLTQATEIGVYSEQDGWYQINSSAQWVSKAYVDLVV